jgi:hypothetical protein
MAKMLLEKTRNGSVVMVKFAANAEVIGNWGVQVLPV